MSNQRYLSRHATGAQPGRPGRLPAYSPARALLPVLVMFWATLALIVTLAATAATAYGQQPGPLAAGDGIKVGERFTVPMLVGGKQVRGRAEVRADRTLVIVFPSADGLSVDELVYALARQDDQQPSPGPGPVPKPPVPVPVPDKLAFIYVIYESQDKLANDTKLAAIKNDQDWRKEARRLGAGDVFFLDQDDRRFATTKGPLVTARAAGLPAAVFVFANGASKGERLAGKTPADMAALIKQYGGAKP